MPGKLPAIQFYPGDWLRDSVAGCSLAAQGLWLRMMILAHDSERYGYLATNGEPIPPEFIARKCGADSLEQYSTLLAELDRFGIPERTPEGIIYSRRMVRDAKARAANASRQRDFKRNQKGVGSNGGGNGGGNAASNANLTGSSSSSSISSSKYKPPRPPDGGIGGKSRRKNRAKSIISLPDIPPNLDTSEFREAWDLWLKYRRERNRAVTPTSAQLTFAKLEEMGVEVAIVAIRESIANNWQGIFAPKNPSGMAIGKHKTIDDVLNENSIDDPEAVMKLAEEISGKHDAR